MLTPVTPVSVFVVLPVHAIESPPMFPLPAEEKVVASVKTIEPAPTATAPFKVLVDTEDEGVVRP